MRNGSHVSQTVHSMGHGSQGSNTVPIVQLARLSLYTALLQTNATRRDTQVKVHPRDCTLVTKCPSCKTPISFYETAMESPGRTLIERRYPPLEARGNWRFWHETFVGPKNNKTVTTPALRSKTSSSWDGVRLGWESEQKCRSKFAKSVQPCRTQISLWIGGFCSGNG